MELSNGNSLEVNQVVVNPATPTQAACSQDFVNSCPRPSLPKQVIVRRSRVLLRLLFNMGSFPGIGQLF